MFLVSADRLKLLLSFAVGGLLGDVFLHLLPEAYGPATAGKVMPFFTFVNVNNLYVLYHFL